MKTDLPQFKQPQNINSKMYQTDSVPMHWHDFYEIELVVSGSGVHTVNGTDYPWKTGEMHLIRLTDFHKITLDGPGMLHLIQIRPSHMPEALLKAISMGKGNLVTYLSRKEFSAANALCLMIEEETSRMEENEETLVEHLLSALLALFFKSLCTHNAEEDNADDILLSKIVIYISENFRENLSLEQIADRFFISKNYLCFYFKKHMNKTVMGYIKELRLEYAAKLVMTTSLKSIEICETCGYGSVSNFLRDFKKRYDLSPLEMRKKEISAKK